MTVDTSDMLKSIFDTFSGLDYIRPEDIPAANRLMYGTEVLCLALCAAAAVLCSHIFR